MFCAGRMAVCDRVPGEEFFLAIVFHEWFVVNDGRMQGTMQPQNLALEVPGYY